MANKIVQYFSDKLKTIKEYPVTVTKAVYTSDGNRLDSVLGSMPKYVDVDETELEQPIIDADKLGGKLPSEYVITDNVLDSMTEINANTEEGKIAGALAVKELAKKINYSTSEIEIGKWIDGKTIYQKTYTGTMPSPTQESGGTRYAYSVNLETFTDDFVLLGAEGVYNLGNQSFVVGSVLGYKDALFFNSAVSRTGNTASFHIMNPYNTTITYSITIKYVK